MVPSWWRECLVLCSVRVAVFFFEALALHPLSPHFLTPHPPHPPYLYHHRINYWPGPIIGFPSSHNDNMSGWPIFAPQDPLNHAPNGTKLEVIQGWSKLMAQWLPFNLATFLTVAGPSTYFTQMVWYAAFQGFVPCPQAPDTCLDPQPIYASIMNKPLGPPLGARVQLSTYRWVRHFQHAVVTLDLDDPLGPGTSIVWNAPQ